MKIGLILASGSPRRYEILKNLGIDFKVMPVDADESYEKGTPVSEIVDLLSRRKALKAAETADPVSDMIIAADTVVSCDNEIFGKPKTREEAYEMLKILSGRCHEVWSGIAVYYNGKLSSESVSTTVAFRELSDSEIYGYIDSGEPFDKAGGYGIQGKASIFVLGINGQYHNVVGLPVTSLEMLIKREFGKSLNDFKYEKE